MTIHEFFMTDEKLAIHCNTIDKAQRLLRLFHENDYRWSGGQRYIDVDYWENHQAKMCYSNERCYSGLDYYQEYGYKILDCATFLDAATEQAEIDYGVVANSFDALMNGDK